MRREEEEPSEGDARGAPEQSDTTATLSISLAQLHELIDQLNNAVNQQQRTLLSTHPSRIKQVALRESGELTRILIYVRRWLDELDQHVQAQVSERDSLSALQEVAATINSSLELDQVLNEVMDVIIGLTKAERALLLLMDEATGRLEVQVARNVDRETIEQSESFQISRSIVGKVAESGEPVVTMNAQEDDRFSAQQSIISYRLRSILCGDKLPFLPRDSKRDKKGWATPRRLRPTRLKMILVDLFREPILLGVPILSNSASNL